MRSNGTRLMFLAMFAVALAMFLGVRLLRRVWLRFSSLRMHVLACGLPARFGSTFVRTRVIGIAERLVVICLWCDAMLLLYGHVRTFGHASGVCAAFARMNIVLTFLLCCARAGRVRQTIYLRRGRMLRRFMRSGVTMPVPGFLRYVRLAHGFTRAYRCSLWTDRAHLRFVDHMEALRRH